MNTPNERELKDLLTTHDTPEAPPGLADRIKAEIPDGLGAAGPAGGPATPPPARFPRRFAWRPLALAASILLMAGGTFLAYRVLRQSMHGPGSLPAIADHVESDDRLAVRSNAGEAGGQAPPAPELAGSTGRDVAVRGGVADESVAAREQLRAPAEPAIETRRRLETSREELRDRPAAGDAPDRPAADTSEIDAEGASEGDLRLEALAYLTDLQAEEPPPASASPPPPADPAPRRRVRKVPIPDPTPGRRAGLSTPGGTATSEIRPMDREAKKLETELEALAEKAPRSQRSVPKPKSVMAAPAETARTFRGGAPRVEPDAAEAAPSTGGSAEPNDAPYGDVFFEGYGVNPFIDTEDDARSTFGLDVDTGSYTVLRRYLHDGHLPPPDAIRVEELINFFDYRDPPPEKGDFAIHAQGAPSIYGQGERYYLLRFNLHGREIDDRDRKPADLTFVVDVSGSMARENRLGLVKKALALLIDPLRGDDRVALVVYGSRGRIVLEPTADHGAIRRAIDALQPEGATNAEEGLRLAYELAERHRRRGAIHRVILCSDGVANVGETSAESILGVIRRWADQGVELTTVGFGMGNYNDVLMERLADTGNGRYAYVDSLDEARRIFVEGLTGTLQTIAAEARVQVEFNPEVVARYRLVGYENRDIADDRFRDDTVDAGEIGAGHTVTVLYELKLHRDLKRRDELGTLHLRWASMAAGEMVEASRRVTGADFAPSWDKAPASLRLTSLVAELAEILKRSYWAREGDLDDVFRRAQRVSAEFAGDREVAEFVSLVGRAADYRRRK